MAAPGVIKSAVGRIRPYVGLRIDVHQNFQVVVMQEGGTNPKPPQRFKKEAFLHWAAKLSRSGAQIYAVYEACGFGFGLQQALTALGDPHCYVVCPQKLDEHNLSPFLMLQFRRELEQEAARSGTWFGLIRTAALTKTHGRERGETR